MPLFTCEFSARSLGKQDRVVVALPQLPGYMQKSHQEGKLRCLYLCHGLSDNETNWSRWTQADLFAQEFGIAIVMMGVARSFYTNMKYGPAYYDYVTKDVPDFVEATFPISTDNRDRFIGGNSMGGYGSMKIALREDGRYAGVMPFSAVCDVEEFFSDEHPERQCDRMLIFGENAPVPDEENIFYLIEKNKSRPKFYMGIGTEDFLYSQNVRLRQKMDSIGYAYHYHEIPGDHNWHVWNELLQDALKYFFPADTTEFITTAK